MNGSSSEMYKKGKDFKTNRIHVERECETVALLILRIMCSVLYK